MRRLFAIALLGFAASCQTAPAPPRYHLTDLSGAYEDFFDRTTAMAPDARVAAFKTEMATVFPGFYDAARVPGLEPSRYDGLIASSFTEFPSLRAKYDRARTGFRTMLDPALASFTRTFPDFHDIGDILLVHSVGEMDGGTRTINGKTYLVFGADMIAKLYEPGTERAFFDHELFHVYHGQFFTDCDAIWCSLWQEGLATYVAATLNPGASDAEIGLTMPAPIRPAVDANLTAAVCAVKTRLNSESPDDYRPLFFGNAHLDGLPARAGYYVGYLMIQEAAKTHSLQELAHMDHAAARPVLDAALANVAACPN